MINYKKIEDLIKKQFVDIESDCRQIASCTQFMNKSDGELKKYWFHEVTELEKKKEKRIQSILSKLRKTLDVH